MRHVPAKVKTDPVLPAGWLELLKVPRHRDFQETSPMERKIGCQSRLG